MLIVGLTGNFGTGKTTVARMFEKGGAKVIDADKITHELMASQGACFHKIVRCFGQGILRDGKINRKKLAAMVFDQPQKLKKLCQILHPVVIREIKGTIREYQKKSNHSIIIIDAPLLIEVGLHRVVDVVIVVTAPFKEQVRRLKRRMNIKRSEIFKRIRSQIGLKEKLKFADIVVDNGGTLQETQKEVRRAWQRIMRMRPKR